MSSQGTECPPVCHSPAPVICQDGEVYCDNGSSGGCHLGNTCMPAGIWFIDSFSINEIIDLFKQFKSARINLSSSLPHSSPRRMCSWWSVVWCWFYSRLERQRDQYLFMLNCFIFPGCSHGNTCMPAGSVCPHVCHIPAPAVCAAGEVWCDNGSNHGCSLGSHCMPAGSVYFIYSILLIGSVFPAV